MRCGRPRTPVRRSSSRSGRTFVRCTAAPSAAPAIQPHRAVTRGSGRASVASDGKIPKLTRNGTIENGVDFSPALYDHADARKTAWAASIPHPRGAESSSAAASAPSAAPHATRSLTSPRAIGLSVRPTARSRGASIASFERPIESWPQKTASVSRTSRHGSSPTAIPIASASAETTRVGPGCVEPHSARIVAENDIRDPLSSPRSCDRARCPRSRARGSRGRRAPRRPPRQ